MIEIKRLDGTSVLTLQDIPEGAYLHRELGGDHYVKMSFATEEPIRFQLGDYVEFDKYGRFELTEPYSPTYNSETGGYDYTLQLNAYYVKWKNKIVRYMPTASASETSFHLTAAIGVHLGVIVNGINAIGAKDSNFLYDGKEFVYQLKNFPSDMVETAKYKQYQNTDFLSALDDLAETFDCEWWVEDNVIFFGKCKIDAKEVEFCVGDNVEKMSASESENDYATRIIAFGSEKNLPSDYRKYSSADITQNGVVQKRLMLPLTGEHACPNGYLQDSGIGNETEATEIVIVDDDIYPRTKCKVSSIETYVDTYTNEETGEEKTKTYYRLYDGSGFNFNSGMILEGETLHILFQSGKMNGMDFECVFDDEKKYYEVVVNEDYGRELPDVDLHPEVDDEFVLYGWDATQIGDTGLIDAAEEELYQAALDKLSELKVDPNTYTCTMMSDWYEEKMRVESLGIWYLGQPVKLISDSFSSGSRSSRVIGYEVKLDITYDSPEYIIGESAAYSRTSDLEQKVDSLTVNGATYQNQKGVGSGVYLITTTSNVPASDYNAYSAARSEKNFLRKNKVDSAKEKIIFEKGATFGQEEIGFIDGSGNANFLSLVVRKLISSENFVSGFSGEGYKLWTDDNGLTNLELDKLTVRQAMSVMELLINKVRAVGGSIIVSAANGKVKSVEDTGDAYKMTLEGDNLFKLHDLIRCQTFTGNDIRSYWVEVSEVGADYVSVLKSEFADITPKVGDEVVLMGNTEDTTRQNLISISATEDGEPRIDVLDGVKSKTLEGALRARLGNLDGISDDTFPLDNKPQGNGLYADNAYLRGTFILSTGEDVKTQLEVVEGKIDSSVEAVRQDFMEDKGYLNNPTFGDGMEHWTTGTVTTFFFCGQKWIWANDNVLTQKRNGARAANDDGRSVVCIKNGYVSQKQTDLRSRPEIETNSDGEKEAIPVYLSFFYRVKTTGTLTIGFENIDDTGFVTYTPLSYTGELDVTQGYVQMSVSGLWNGTGDFKISFTGEIYVYMFVLSTDRIESLTYKYRTLFEQSEKLVQIAAANFDADGNVLESSSIITTSKYNALISEKFNEDGSLKNTAGVVTTTNFESWVRDELAPELDNRVKTEAFAGLYASAVEADTNVVKKADISAMVTKDADGNLESSVKVKADNIVLEGAVTANGNFKVLDDGSIETENAKIGGYLYTTFKRVADSDASLQSDGSYLLGQNLYVDATGELNGEGETIMLPVAAAYEGARVIVVNNNYSETRIGSLPNAYIKAADGSMIMSGQFDNDSAPVDSFAEKVEIDRGAVELAMQSVWAGYDDTGGNTYALQWVLLSTSCRNMYYTYNGVRYACKTNRDAQ